MTSRTRDLDFIRAAEARRHLNRRACQAGLSGAALRVWVIVSDYTLGYCRVSDALTHGRIAEDTGLSRRSVSRALAEVAGAGLIRYRAGVGDPTQGRNAFSRITVVMPISEPEGGDDHMDPSGNDESVPSPREEGTGLSGGRRRVCQEGADHMVPSRDDSPVVWETTSLSTNRERAPREGFSEREQTREGTRGVVTEATEVQYAREDGFTPAPERPGDAAFEVPEGSASGTRAEPEWDGELDSLNDWLEQVSPTGPAPEPVMRRIGAATGEQAVQRFEAEAGLPLSTRTKQVLVTSLNEVAPQVTPNELLMSLGYWHEKRGGRWPEDAAERVGEAMGHDHGCNLDPCNGMTPEDAIQEGRCRARMDALPRRERDALESNAWARLTGHGLAWPAPVNVRGLIPESAQVDAFDPFSIPLGHWKASLAGAGVTDEHRH